MKNSIKYILVLVTCCFVWLPAWAAIQNDFNQAELTEVSKNKYELKNSHFQQNVFIEDDVNFVIDTEDLSDSENFSFSGNLNHISFQARENSLFNSSRNLTNKEDRRKKVLQHIYPFHFFF
ncbi:hypothetical protein [Mesonia aestuariivivens]|uniref:Uncharacterized protein n=1 Tax=Mesonia aestuariivivens TaxID=2796128 RepID=A0ABS6W1G3_9FLAO|nr:hypothetical protein [Mesonia aestuariivivens]MBW2961659.1 hypothetical protein [Mesonia aestuariivivens]